jgi:tetratricopeptide (TPR) repeat protein
MSVLHARLLATALSGALATAACARDDAAIATCPDLDAGRPVDPVLLAFLGRARAAHHAADAHEQGGDLPAAAKSLEALLAGPLPGGSPPPAEAREVLADARARLADLQSRLGNFDAALREIERGLTGVPQTSYFRGHLFEVRGLVEERRSKALRESGDQAGAEQARQRALEAFEESMRIQAEVIRGVAP